MRFLQRLAGLRQQVHGPGRIHRAEALDQELVKTLSSKKYFSLFGSGRLQSWESLLGYRYRLRETVDRLIAFHLADRVGAEFTARVSGVTKSGLFVRLAQTGADGFIPISTLGEEYFEHNETAHALVGSRTGQAFRLGDTVNVKLLEAVPTAGALRFEMLTKGQCGVTPMPSGIRGQRRARGRLGRR